MKYQISNIKSQVITGLYLMSVIALFFYSYTQVDLGLTLTRHPLLYPIQRIFQNIGYFHRSLSTYIYIAILIVLLTFYLFFIIAAWKDSISAKLLWFVIFVQSAILLFSYNAFSYDIFNYIFYGRIIIHYHQNPYFHVPFDYPGDPMLGFMHWTQATLPYGPAWLLISLPFSFVGFQYFLLTFFLFKGLATLAYLGSVYCVWNILKNTLSKEKIIGMTLFALNPLVIIESLVSGHNDIVLIFFTLFAVYLFTNKRYIRSFIMFLIGFGVKFINIFIFPAFLYAYFLQKNNTFGWRKIFIFSAMLMSLPIIVLSFRTNFQPWYLLSALTFASLAGKRLFVVVPVFVMTFFSLLEYIPFLWTGNWNPPIPTILFWLTIIGVIISAASVFLFILKRRNMVQLERQV